MWKFVREDLVPYAFLCIGMFLFTIQMKRFDVPSVNLTLEVAGVLVSLLFGGAAVVELRERRKKKERTFRLMDVKWAAIGLTSVVVFTMTLSGYALATADTARALYEWLSNPGIDRSDASAVVAVLVCVAGVTLFWFRLHMRACYGAVEVLVGVYVALSQVQSAAPGVALTERSVLLALLTAGVYLVVRGLDNVHQGCTGSKPDRIAVLLMRLFTRRKPAPAPVLNKAE